MTGILSQVVQRGTGTAAQLGARPVAGKTGTANEWRDAWFVGYTPDLVTAVWVGFPERQRSMVPPATPIRVTGGSWPAQIWRRVMEPALGDSPITAFPVPEVVAPAHAGGLVSAAGRPTRCPCPTCGASTRPRPVRCSRRPGSGSRPSGAPPGSGHRGWWPTRPRPRGRRSLPGATVVIGVSSGAPRPVVIVNTVGFSVDRAARMLQASGLNVEIVVEDPPEGVRSSPGRVWKQTPDGGAVIDEGQTVRIWAQK